MAKLQLYFGGSFDPLHLGHIRSMQALLAHCEQAELTLVPNALSPLKAQQHISPAHRRALLELSLQAHTHIRIDWREVERGGASYTAETLSALRAEHGCQPMAFVMGQDSFNQLTQWKNWQNLCDNAHLVVIARPGYQQSENEALQSWLAPRLSTSLTPLFARPSGHVYFCQLPPQPISSTALRQACQQNQYALLRQYLPSAALDYIKTHGLYHLEHA